MIRAKKFNIDFAKKFNIDIDRAKKFNLTIKKIVVEKKTIVEIENFRCIWKNDDIKFIVKWFNYRNSKIEIVDNVNRYVKKIKINFVKRCFENYNFSTKKSVNHKKLNEKINNIMNKYKKTKTNRRIYELKIERC